MTDVLQLAINGLALGAVYSLVAMGITMIYSAVNRVNFSQAAILTFGAYIAYAFRVPLRTPLVPTFIVTVLAMALFGVAFERLAYHPVRRRSKGMFMIVAIGWTILLENVVMVIWSPIPKYFPLTFGNRFIQVGSLRILPQHVLVLAIVGLIVALQTYLFKRTLLGKQMRASAQDPEAASLMGINVSSMTRLTFVLSSVFAGVGGILLAPLFFLSPQMNGPVMLRAFAGSLIGGFGNVPGAVLGGLVVGLVETALSSYVSSTFRDAFLFLGLIVFLVVRPRGIFGEPISEKV